MKRPETNPIDDYTLGGNLGVVIEREETSFYAGQFDIPVLIGILKHMGIPYTTKTEDDVNENVVCGMKVTIV